ncbi:MAG: UvrD-helicase domain-containing protein [Rickettsiales bacterium]|nr:UvrD-helicase domain-containing protein [Rickettsiales bacterium]
MSSEITKLNQAQQEAVKQTDGPLLVLAGAGTGKTRVLTSRIIHIVNSHLASPSQILAVTFTNKAAAEMKKRIGEVVHDQVNNLWIGTFHAIAARILRRHPEVVGLRSDFTIIDADDQTRLLKQILTDFNIDTKQFPAKNYLGKISRLKDQMVTPAKLESESLEVNLPKLKEVYETYQYRLKSMNACDFGDLLLYNLEIFSKSPEILSYYQDKFRYVLVDEYQDTNGSQYRWLLTLAALHKNICCVGDDDQSIYSWRGANIANILRFEKDFKDAKVIRLEQNYRSTSNILKAADHVISNNKERHGKTLWTDEGKGERVKVISFADDRMEAQVVCSLIKQLYASGFKLSDIAVLVRAGYQTRSFEESFMQNSLAYRVIGGLKFYERMEIRDAIAYLRLVANSSDNLALSRIINVPKRGVGESTISNIYQKAKNDNISLFASIKKMIEAGELKGKSKDALKELVDYIEKWNGMSQTIKLSELADVVMRESGYVKMWQNENSLEAQGRIDNINEFTRSLEEFSSLIEFLEYVSLVEARDDKSVQDSVNIMTIHAAKGLEFNLVFVPGLEEGIFPSSRSVEERNGLEEERRLLYVAITRARKNLYLSYAKSRYVFGDYQMSLPSRFIEELPKDEIDFEEKSFGGGYGFNTGFNYSKSESNFSNNSNYNSSKWQAKKSSDFFVNNDDNKQSNSPMNKRIFHQKFGYGKVISIDGNKFEIDFEKTGRKVVIKDFVTFA